MKLGQKAALSAAAIISTFALAAALGSNRGVDRRTGDEHFRSGVALAKQADIEEAIIEFCAALRTDPDNSKAYYHIGLLLEQTGDQGGAEAALRRAVHLEPDFAEAHDQLGEVLAKRDWKSAVPEFRAALRCRQTYPEAQNRLGALLLESGDVKEAEALIKAALLASPDLAEAHSNLGLAYENQSSPDAAVAEFRKAIQLQPMLAQAHYELGKILREQRDLDGARQELEAALRSNPDLQEGHYQLARVLQAQGHLQAAQVEFEEAQSLNQRKEKAAEAIRLSNQGLDLAAKGDFPGAARSLREATDANPDFALAHFNLGLVLADSSDLKTATVELRTAIYLRPGAARPYYELGRVLERAGNRSAAISALERAAELDPADTRAVESLRTLGIQWTVGRERRSKDQNVSAGPFTATGLDELGMSLRRQGNFPGAIAMFLRALSLEPDFYPARRNLASAYMERNAYHEASLEYRKMLILRSDDAQVHFQFGLCLEKNGDTGAAIEQFRMVQRDQPDFAQAQEQIKALLRKESVH